MQKRGLLPRPDGQSRYASICMPPAGSVVGQSARERATGIFHDRMKAIATHGMLGISRTHRESGDQKRSCANENQETPPMTKCLLVSMSAILSAAIATPLFAQAVAQEPAAYALYLPNAGKGIGSAPPQRQDVRPWKTGSETATTPWSAPAGHHQPTAADVLKSDSQPTLDQENANVDRIVGGVCRGC
jgi:hypothetical protein